MAGADPLGGLYEPTPEDMGFDLESQLSPRMRRRFALVKKIMDQQKRQEDAEAGAVELEAAGLDDIMEVEAPEVKYTRGLDSREGYEQRKARKASPHGELLDWIDQTEAELGDMQAKGIQSQEDIDAYFSKNEKLAAYLDKLYEGVRSGTLESFKAGELDAQGLNERLNMLLGEVGKEGRTGGMRAAGGKVREAVEKQRAAVAEQLEDAKTRQEFAEALAEGKTPAWLEAMDPTGAIRGTIDWQPVKEAIKILAGPVEIAGGLAGMASEKFTGVDYETDVSLGDVISEGAGPGAVFNEEAKIRQRGKEFYKKFGEEAATAWEQSPELIKLPIRPTILGGAMATMDMLEAAGKISPKDAHEYRALTGQVALEIAADPLNVVDFGPGVLKSLSKIEKAVLTSKPFLKFAVKYPKIAYAPSKFIRSVTGHAKAAMTMGDEGMTNVYTAERAFTEEAGYEFYRLRADALEGEAALVGRLETPLHAKLYDDLPRMVEMGKDGRMAIRETVETDDIYQQTLLDAADFYDDIAARAIALEHKWGMKTQALTGDFAYFGRQFSDELLDFLAKNKTAQHALFGEQIGRGKDGLLHNLQSWEKHRRTVRWDFYESEERLRQVFSRMGYSPDKPIWSRDAFGMMAKRAEKSFNTAKVRKLYMNFVHEFGKPVSPSFVDDAMKAWSEIERPAAVGRPGVEVEGLKSGAEKARQKATAEGERATRAARATQAANARAKAAREKMGKMGGQGGAEARAKAARKQAKDDYFAAQDDFNKAAPKAYTKEWAKKNYTGADGHIDAAAMRAEVQRAVKEAGGAEVVADGKRIKVDADMRDANGNQWGTDAAVLFPDKPGDGVFISGDAVKDAANKRMQEATERLLKAQADLKRAKAAGRGADAEEVARLEREVADATRQAEKAKAAYEEATRKASEYGAEATRYEDEYAKAYAEWEKAAREAQVGNPDNWSADAKADWVLRRRPGHFRTRTQPRSALDVLIQANAELPDDIGELARLAGTYITRDDALKLERYMKSFYWHHLDTPQKVGKYYDAIKRIFQRAVLARFGSASVDNIGAFTQGLLAGNVAFLNDARKALGGDPLTWAKGAGKAWRVDDDVARGMAEGWLRTTKGEALEGGTTFTNPFLKGIEERGVLGGMIPGRAGEAVGKFTDSFMHQRVWFEEVQRLATYRMARANGASHRAAVEEVYTHFGKFDELTKLERNVLSRIFFFWSWMQRSMPVTIAMMFEHPVRMRLMLTAMAGDSINENADEVMPEWLKRMGGWILGQDEAGNVDVLSTGRGSYAGPLFSMLQGDMVKTIQSGDYEKLPGEALREVARSSPPFMQALPELAFQKDMFTNKDWWKDPSMGGGSNMKAPTAFYWLMDPSGQKPTALQKLLGLKAEYNEDTKQFQRVTMNPYWAWILDALPGVAPLLSDASAYVDPRSTGALHTDITLGGDPIRIDLGRGTARQIGFPIYRVQPPDDVKTKTWKMREALTKDVNRLSSGSLIYMNGNIIPNKKSLRGMAIERDRAQWRKEAKEQGMPQNSAQWRKYTRDRMARKYTEEYRLMELADRLDVLLKLARGEEEVKPLNKGVGIKVKSPEDKLAKQAKREGKRKLARLRGLR